MTARSNILGLTISNDGIIDIGVWPSQPLPPNENLSLKLFANLALRWSNHEIHLLRTQQMALRKSCDYDGHPFEDFYEVRYGASSRYKASDDPSIFITFCSTHDDDYDYKAMASLDTSTGYKRGPAHQPNETKFKVSSAIIKRREGSADLWVQGELVRLLAILDELDQATESLVSWAASGFDMRVFCPSGCRADPHPKIIPNSQLSIYVGKNLSLEEFKGKLKCSDCGARCKSLSVA